MLHLGQQILISQVFIITSIDSGDRHIPHNVSYFMQLAFSYYYIFRAKERERKKKHRKQAREQNIDLGPSRKTLKRNTMEHSACRIRVVIDCSFDNLMTERVGYLTWLLDRPCDLKQ